MYSTTVMIKMVHPDSKMPSQAKFGDAGYDVCSVEHDFILQPGERKIVDTGLQMAFPVGMKCEVCPRSGLAAKYGITVVNTPGTVDSSYRGNILVILINHGKESFEIKKGDRIAQLIFVPVFAANFVRANDLPESDRGEGGIGHTGVR